MFSFLTYAAVLVLAVALDHAPNPQDERTFKVLTFNVDRQSPDNRERFSRSAQMILESHASIALLQEVSFGWFDFASAEDFFAEKTLFPYHVSSWSENYWIYRSGVTILSHFPLQKTGELRFSRNQGLETKGAVAAIVDTPLGKWGILNVHLAPQVGTEVKRGQLQELAEWIEKTGFKGLMGGDFNESSNTSDMQDFLVRAKAFEEVFSAGSRATTWTENAANPCGESGAGERIDSLFWVGGHGVQIEKGHVILQKMPAISDHCAVEGLITLPSPVLSLPSEPGSKLSSPVPRS